MAYNYTVSNTPLPPNAINPPPPPPPMTQMMGMMGQQGMSLGYIATPLMTGQTSQTNGSSSQQQVNIMNPAMNDAPLEFNTNKNKPPMPISGDEPSNRSRSNDDSHASNNISSTESTSSRRERRTRSHSDRRDRDRDRDRERDRREDRETPTQSSSTTPQVTTALTPTGIPSPTSMAASNLWGGMMGPVGYSVMGMNMMGSSMSCDPSMMTMGQYPVMGGMMPDGTLVGPEGAIMPADPAIIGTTPVVKEIIHCKSCTLFPPNPNAPPPTTRERPPGCRTVFVGGLPENTTEEIIREIFERCGEMTTIRLSKKNFCHIRFVFESSVYSAIYLSGYRMRIGSNTDPPNTGRLHVDYAQARDDLYEWECRQRALQREQRHRERMEQERLRPPSPPPVVHYTDHEAAAVSEKIKDDESFSKAVQVVITWLERGDCNKRNANTFYTMIQSTNSHVRRLLNEKANFEEELQRAKELMKGRMQGILIQFGQIERVFTAACHKKVWDHFTKAQRKNIEMWKKQAAEIKSLQLEEVLNERADEEMEVSDTDDDAPMHKKRRSDSEEKASYHALKEENDSLRCQLEAYKNEVDLVRTDLKADIDQKDKQIKVLQQTLQGIQQQLMESKRRQTDDESKMRDLQSRLKASSDVQARLQAAACAREQISVDSMADKRSDKILEKEDDKERTDSIPQITAKDAKLIGLVSVFLNVHPFGAGVDYIWSFLQKMDQSLRPAEVEILMSRFPTVFRQELSGIGANMERRWLFDGFNSDFSNK